MKAAALAGLFALNVSGGVAAAGAMAPEVAGKESAKIRLTDPVVERAVRETLAETKENPRRHEADVLRADKWQVFSEEFHESKVPDCLHPDGLKRQPPTLGPISFQYLFAVPFVVLAKVRGKCL